MATSRALKLKTEGLDYSACAVKIENTMTHRSAYRRSHPGSSRRRSRCLASLSIYGQPMGPWRRCIWENHWGSQIWEDYAERLILVFNGYPISSNVIAERTRVSW